MSGEGSNGFGQAAIDDLTRPVEQMLPSAPPEAESLDEEQKKSIFEKIRFSWRPEDQVILSRLQATVDEEFSNNFGDVVTILDHLYASIRVPLMEPRGAVDPATGRPQLMPVLDHQGRQVWEADPANPSRAREDIDQLTGQDVAEALLRLEAVRLNAVPRVAQLLSEAIYAKMVSGDVHDDRWWSMMDGTISDKNSQANRESRPDRYHAFFRYSLWLTSNEFLAEVGRFMDRLEKIGTWKSFERGR